MTVNVLNQLFLRSFTHRIPLSATIELTGNCNFRCVHCYIAPEERLQYLSIDNVKSFVDQIHEAGCLYVTLTGGETLLHPSFVEIYSYIARKGMIITVFTNGSLINDDIIRLFKCYRPKGVEITLYGASEETYRATTNAYNKFDTVKQNILMLKKHQINVTTKMFIVKENKEDYSKIISWVSSEKIPFRFDDIIIAEPNSHELEHQICQEDIQFFEDHAYTTSELVDPDLRVETYINRTHKLFQCGAGRTSCVLKSNNMLRGCNFLSCFEYDMGQMSFKTAWSLMEHWTELSIDSHTTCSSCQNREYCSYCPAISMIMKNDFSMSMPNDQFCIIAQSRKEKSKFDAN